MKIKNNKIAFRLGTVILSLILAFSVIAPMPIISDNTGFAETNVYAATKKPTYTINANSKPYFKKWAKYTTYNKYSKHWYLFRSYMERFEKTGGGTLIVKKGTYYLPISVQVPSNVTIKFQNGVIIKKISKTGTSKLHKNGPMFQLIAPSKYSKTNAVTNYNGTKNVSFIGSGTVKFQMNKVKGDCCIIMAQNQNVTVKNISFLNCGGHFFELDASKKVTIDSCKFSNITNTDKTCEAINLDTPDSKTGGFSFRWSKKDKKPNVGVTIKNCSFTNMNRAIGTHKYSQINGKNVMHQNITISNNTFTKMRGFEGAIMTYNWKNFTISGNTFKGNGTEDKTFAIAALSVVSANIKNNSIENFANTIIFRRGFASSGYSDPQPLSLTEAQIELLITNQYKYNTVVTGEAQYTENPYWASGKMIYYPLTVYGAPEEEADPVDDPENPDNPETPEQSSDDNQDGQL